MQNQYCHLGEDLRGSVDPRRLRARLSGRRADDNYRCDDGDF
jgi:hypothetical protein